MGSKRKRDEEEDDKKSKKEKKEKKDKKDKKDKKEKKEKKEKKDKKEKKEKKPKDDKEQKKQNKSLKAFEKEDRKRKKREEKEEILNKQRIAQIELAIQANQEGPQMNRAPSYIRMDDYFRKHTELTMWVWECFAKRLHDLDNSECMEHYFKFVVLWNAKKLDSKYYKGVHSSELDPEMRTAYKWGFTKQVDSFELASARDQVDTDTNEKRWDALPKEFRKRRETEEDAARRESFENREKQRAEEDPFEQRRRWAERKAQREKEEKIYGGAVVL